MIRKLIVEAVGTFFLVFTIGQVVIGTQGTTVASLAPFAISATLMAMIYAGGHISGAHYNPAVTLAVWLRGKAAAREVLPYWAAQTLGALLAVVPIRYLKSGLIIVPGEVQLVPAMLAEFLFTFALCFVVLNVATARGTEGNSNYGLAIAFTVMAGIFAVGGVSGGIFNPAVAVGVTALGLSGLPNLWIYILAQLLAGGLAGALFNGLNLGGDRPLHAEAAAAPAVSSAAATGGSAQ